MGALQKGGRLCLHPRIVILAFGMKKRSLHKHHIRFSRYRIRNDAECKVSIQEGPGFFQSCIVVIIGIAVVPTGMDRAAVAVAVGIAVAVTVTIATIDRAEDAAAVAIAITAMNRGRAVTSLMVRLCDYYNVITAALGIIDTIHTDVAGILLADVRPFHDQDRGWLGWLT
jgi:hypothetical protein